VKTLKTIKVGYARVSTREDRQKNGLSIQKRALKKERCDYIFWEKESGTKDDRQQLANAVHAAKFLADRDYKVKFIVYKLDRLARHLVRSAEVIGELQKHDVQFVSLKEEIDTSTPVGILQYQMLGMFSEFEVNQIRQRTREGVAEARRKGKQLGRPRTITKKQEEEVCRLYQLPEYPIQQIINTTGVGRSSIFIIAKRHNLYRRRKSMTI